VWPVIIVLLPEGLHDDPCLPPIPEDLSVQTFIPQLIVETLNIAVLPGTARLDK